MKDFAREGAELIKAAGADYGDIRILRLEEESIEVKNRVTEGLSRRETLGFGIRLLKDGSWGFAASSGLTRRALEKTVRLALRVARSSRAASGKGVSLALCEGVVATYRTAIEKDPFKVPVEEKLALLSQATEILSRESKVKLSQAFYDGFRTHKVLATTGGSLIEQEIIECGAGIAATAIEGQEVQVRSFPNSFRGNFGTAGYEFVERMELLENAPRVASEAAALLRAPQCPSGRFDVILDGGQLALQIHESIGHPIELDRVLGTELSFAGGSFLSPADVGQLKYGSEFVNVVADATVPSGLGTFGFDDEGTKAQRTDIIRRGIFSGFLSSRETASEIGNLSSGAMRADSWKSIPLIRMTNVNLLAGTWDLDALIQDTEGGLFLATNRSWSIDDKRVNFQFGTELAFRIEGGKLGKMFKNPTYTGITTDFWSSCDAVCNSSYWKMWGTPNCGKGEPMQVAHVGHGASPARFRNVEVGVMK